ncbi:nucleoside phosphorylase [Mesonia ostreae]|uniref:Uridine phosphorylase n=1 Tax=Mesonia ostreae TaxID=861110 RepID=A0ABU2KHQ0_9FLAO|nr:nucleoside phosphorylase [Mesonia ostreae]MDT0294247.1 nucleoside phosphorylase [Mesonia ostreae]
MIKESELILNADGSVYHLNLKPENIANLIITVGDPDRIDSITKHFDSVEFKTQKREFQTQTGTYKNKRITVVSTGIGTDNIDIVLNELDALANINLKTREFKEEQQQLTIIRIGTSGSIQKEIPVDAFLASEKAVGFDGLLYYYQSDAFLEKEFAEHLHEYLDLHPHKARPYVVSADQDLVDHFSQDGRVFKGVTGTNVGFYAPQGRVLRAGLQDPNFIDQLTTFKFQDYRITNLEMETSAIYGLSKLLGHKAVSMNAIIANRETGDFSKDSLKAVEHLILYTLDKIITL